MCLSCSDRREVDLESVEGTIKDDISLKGGFYGATERLLSSAIGCFLPAMSYSLHVIPAVIRAFGKQMVGLFCAQLLPKVDLSHVDGANNSGPLF